MVYYQNKNNASNNPKNPYVSQYNEGQYQLDRLNELWKKAEVRAASGMMNDWNWVLDGIWRELYPNAMRNKGKEGSRNWEKEIDDFNKKISEATKKNNRAELYKQLDLKHKMLKVLQDAVGKGTKYKDFDEDAYY